MTKDIFDAYRKDGWHIFKLIKTKDGDGNAVKGLYKTPLGWNDSFKTYDYHEKWVYGGVPPEDIVAIDWDVKNGKKHGDVSFQKLQDFLNIPLDTCVATPSGGGHCYMRLHDLPEDTPKLKKTQDNFPDIEFQSHGSEFVVLGGQTVEGYGEYNFLDEDFEYFVNDIPLVDLTVLELRRKRVQGEGYDNTDIDIHVLARPQLEEIQNMLSNISPDSDHDGGWQQVAMCLNSWDLNGNQGEKLFVDWSLTSEKYVVEEGEEAIKEAAIKKYAACIADTPDYYNKLFTLNATAKVANFDNNIEASEYIEDLEKIASDIKATKMHKDKREAFIEKLSTKCKKLTGKPEKVTWKNAVKYVDAIKAKERQDDAEQNGLPDFTHTEKGVKYLNTYANLKEFIANHSQHEFMYDIILKRLIINNNYGIETGEQTIAYSLLSDELVRYGLSNAILTQHFEAVSFSNSDNPLMNHVKAIPEWDKETDYIKLVADTLTTKIADEKYKRAVMQSFCIQAIAAWDGRDSTPHKLSKLDNVMTFVGNQGIGKTTWVGALMPNFMKAYFKDGVELNPSDKDSYIQAINAGLVELGELDATNRKSDISSLKAFLSNTEDEFRAPYGRSAEKFKRQTVFVGTVNNTDFLKDATGSRRFLVLDASKLDLPSPDIVEGMWSQALHLYLKGTDWRLSEKHDKTRETINKGFTDVGVAGDLAEEFSKTLESCKGRKSKVSITKILNELGVKMNGRERSDFVASLDRHGMSRYSDGKYYLPSDIFSTFKMNVDIEEFENIEDDEDEF